MLGHVLWRNIGGWIWNVRSYERNEEVLAPGLDRQDATTVEEPRTGREPTLRG